ncbi:MAG: ClbS/DfsB family four-helix bundle protein [Pseudomonadota bacterium]
MPATSKQELQTASEKEFGKLQCLIDELPEQLWLEKDEEGITPKDVIAHRAHWIELFLGWYADGQQGLEVFFPAKGYKWNEIKRYNADLRQLQSGLTWTSALSELSGKHVELTALIENLSNDQLYGAPMKGAKNHWATGRWAEAAGPSHYRSATKYLRQRLKAFRRSSGT